MSRFAHRHFYLLLLLLWHSTRCLSLEVFFEEQFDDESWRSRWVHSKWKGVDGERADFAWGHGPHLKAPGGRAAKDGAQHPLEEIPRASWGLETVHDNRYNVISAAFPPFSNKGRDLVIQYSVRHYELMYRFCAGGYIKVLPEGFDQERFGANTLYAIMFGPNICGYDKAHFHITFHYGHNHLHGNMNRKFSLTEHTQFTRFYTLHIMPNDTYTFYIDHQVRATGSLRDHWDFAPPTRDDPRDRMPSGWDNRARIPHPLHSTKPEEWHDEKKIPDPSVPMPQGWDEEEDGPWRPPMVKNPQYKGVWKRRYMKNPAFKGEWVPKQLPHPEFKQEAHSYESLGGVGFELWTAAKGTIFDNVLLCDSLEHAKRRYDEFLPARQKEEQRTAAMKVLSETYDYERKHNLEDLPPEEEEVELDDPDDVGDVPGGSVRGRAKEMEAPTASKGDPETIVDDEAEL